MKYIKSGKEPNCLAELRKIVGATFGDLNRKKEDQEETCKEKIRKSLLETQGFLCAYCMRRISSEPNPKLSGQSKTEIEHYRSQTRYKGENGRPDLRLDYKNMLAVCNGNTDNPKHANTCDKSKSLFDKKEDLFVSPLVADREKQIYYTIQGEIASKDERINRDLDKILNLNERNICEKRRQLYELTKQEIRSIKKRLWNKPQRKQAALYQLKVEWETKHNGKLRELCRVPLYLIEKELAKLQQ